MNFLSVAGISKKKDEEFVLKDISFSMQRFKNIAIAGETGSGKSTLLKIIAGLIQPDAGEVLFEQERVLGPEEKLLPGHPAIAYLSQHFELRNNYKVEEILEMANKMDAQEAELIFEVCQIAHLLKRRTDQLSGGEKQRIAMARLLITMPKLLLLDEPYSNLDMLHKNTMKSVIHDISDLLKITCILISHDPLDTLSWAEEIIVMKDGIIVQRGTSKDIYTKPCNEYVGGLFGKYNLLLPSLLKNIWSDRIPQLNKKLFIRPEDVAIVSAGNKAIAGQVNKISFFGSYYEAEVAIEGTMITVKTMQPGLAKGDEVHLSFHPQNLCYV